jgi:hypothetical protein
MKKLFFVLSLLISITTVIALCATSANAQTVTCPPGDKYKCYATSKGTVYKGDGYTVIVL